jgi:hypothetical protein
MWQHTLNASKLEIFFLISLHGKGLHKHISIFYYFLVSKQKLPEAFISMDVETVFDHFVHFIQMDL